MRFLFIIIFEKRFKKIKIMIQCVNTIIKGRYNVNEFFSNSKRKIFAKKKI